MAPTEVWVSNAKTFKEANTSGNSGKNTFVCKIQGVVFCLCADVVGGVGSACVILSEFTSQEHAAIYLFLFF